MEKIYKLKFGESSEIKTEVSGGNRRIYTITYIVTRVPGGWIFKRDLQGSVPIFIPFDNEFQLINSK